MDKKPSKIIVLDDDMRLRELLKRYLSEQGFTVEAVADGNSLERALSRERFDLLVLDLMLPGQDGLSICRHLRSSNNSIPIIMLTAMGEDVDRIVGLEMGADDYLSKPFNPRELLARIHAVLRRQPSNGIPAAPTVLPEGQHIIEFGPFEFNLNNRTLFKHGLDVNLTSGEYALLRVLVTHPREPLSREKLMDMARGREHEVFDRSIDVQISRLRRLIEVDSSKPRFIQTVWGFGYVFVPDNN
ncbi:MAG: two-component response regulator OmpR [Ferrovum sp. 37-45-19]|nr:MAG: two-component response regulator OmpR [Ferrovum sp. 21-44-67]OYV93770.1 MAG: two-component response regulator OmpR [Ferrovum sp. 37-45-19]OZB32297.1 MAG: two-component response regulator OmpR [Ferrovum sp. 34-44-207]